MGEDHLIPIGGSLDGMDIVMIAQQDWSAELGSNCRNIAVEFAKCNRVLYVNPALDRITIFRSNRDPAVNFRRQVIQGKSVDLVEVQENLWVLYPDVVLASINWLLSDTLFAILNKRNNRLLATSIQRATKRIGFEQFALFNDNEMFRGFYLKEFLVPRLSVYYLRDYMLGVPYWKKHGRRAEPLLIAKSDLCLTNSEYLANYAKKFNSRTVNVGQGCDPGLFVSPGRFQSLPDMDAIHGVKLGYVGVLNAERLDMSIIEYIARCLPDCNIVLVGPQDKSFLKSRLHQISNVFFLGHKREEDLPAYINAFDVCLNPQQINELTIGNYPRKIDEYLLLGKPVVATATEAMEMFSDYVYLANSKEKFITLIKRALAEHTDEACQARIRFALTHTWENSINRIKEAIIACLHVKV